MKWIPDRQEAFLSDVQGRDHVSLAEMALDKDCKFLGLRVTTYAALGAYLSHFGAFIPTMAGSGMLAGLYQTPTIYVNVKGVMTNTVPTDAYRGAGRPEAAYLLERFVDHIGRETGLGPAEIRKRNLVKPNQIPWNTALGDTFDSGDFDNVMLKGMEKADWKRLPGPSRGVTGQGQVARHGHGDLCREVLGRCAGERHREVQRRRHDHRLRRRADQRPGPRDRLHADHVGAARCRCRSHPHRPGRSGLHARGHDRR